MGKVFQNLLGLSRKLPRFVTDDLVVLHCFDGDFQELMIHFFSLQPVSFTSGKFKRVFAADYSLHREYNYG